MPGVNKRYQTGRWFTNLPDGEKIYVTAERWREAYELMSKKDEVQGLVTFVVVAETITTPPEGNVNLKSWYDLPPKSFYALRAIVHEHGIIEFPDKDLDRFATNMVAVLYRRGLLEHRAGYRSCVTKAGKALMDSCILPK